MGCCALFPQSEIEIPTGWGGSGQEILYFSFISMDLTDPLGSWWSRIIDGRSGVPDPTEQDSFKSVIWDSWKFMDMTILHDSKSILKIASSILCPRYTREGSSCHHLSLPPPALKWTRGRVVSFYKSACGRGEVSFPWLHFRDGQMLWTGQWSLTAWYPGLKEMTLACICTARTLGGSRVRHKSPVTSLSSSRHWGVEKYRLLSLTVLLAVCTMGKLC